jgi:hypothetical protein
LLAVLGAFVVVFAGSCSASTSPQSTEADSGDPDVSETATGSPTPANLSCDLAPASLVKSTLGADVSPPAQIANANGIECTYLTGIGGRTVVIRFANGDGKDAFAIGRQGYDASGQPTTDVTDLGDEAYRSSTEFGDVVTITLVARKGSVEMLVAAVATVEQEKALVQKVFDSLS